MSTPSHSHDVHRTKRVLRGWGGGGGGGRKGRTRVILQRPGSDQVNLTCRFGLGASSRGGISGSIGQTLRIDLTVVLLEVPNFCDGLLVPSKVRVKRNPYYL